MIFLLAGKYLLRLFLYSVFLFSFWFFTILIHSFFDTFSVLSLLLSSLIDPLHHMKLTTLTLPTLSLLCTTVVLTALPVQALPGRPMYPTRQNQPSWQNRPVYPRPMNVPPYQPNYSNQGYPNQGYPAPSNPSSYTPATTPPATSTTPTSPAAASPSSTQPNSASTTPPANSVGDIYKLAQQELPQDYYVLYRIVDRLARANSLDDYAWRVAITSQANSSPFMAEANKINIYNGTIDQLYGDLDGLACAVSHEMAHSVQRQQASGDVGRAAIFDQLKAFVEGRTPTTTTATTSGSTSTPTTSSGRGSDFLTSSVGRSLIGQVASMIAGNPGVLIANVLSGLLERETSRQPANTTTDGLTATNNPNNSPDPSQNPLSTLLHEYEFEADSLAYQYAARAGFDPQGCSRAINALSRFSSTTSQAFPSTTERSERLAALQTQYPATTLATEGETKLRQSAQPLRYSLVDNQTALRLSRNDWASLNDRFSMQPGSAQTDIYYPIQWGDSLDP